MIAMHAASAPQWPVPADDVADEDTDVLSLAGQPVPDDGAWLWITAADPQPGGELAGLFLPRYRPLACGGDVLAHLRPAAGPDGGPAAQVRVWAVAAGWLARVAGWDLAGLHAWPEMIRDPAVFAMGALRELEQHGGDIADSQGVEVIPAAEAPAAGFPALPTRVKAAG